MAFWDVEAHPSFPLEKRGKGLHLGALGVWDVQDKKVINNNANGLHLEREIAMQKDGNKLQNKLHILSLLGKITLTSMEKKYRDCLVDS